MAEARAVWWRTQFPWHLIGSLVRSSAGVPLSPVLRFSPDGNAKRYNACATVSDLRAHVVQRAAQTVSLHVVPDATRFIVFDCDVRQQERGHPAGFDICRGQRHDERELCIGCWRWAVAAALILDEQVAKPFGLSRAPLYVFSGGNGLHVWYPLPPAGAAAGATGERPQLLSEPAARRFLFARWLTREACAANEALVAALRLLFMDDERVERTTANVLAAFHVRFDEDVTTKATSHMLRLPFSLHDRTGEVAQPLGCKLPGGPATLRHPAAVLPRSAPADVQWLLAPVTMDESRAELARFVAATTPDPPQ